MGYDAPNEKVKQAFDEIQSEAGERGGEVGQAVADAFDNLDEASKTQVLDNVAAGGDAKTILLNNTLLQQNASTGGSGTVDVLSGTADTADVLGDNLLDFRTNTGNVDGVTTDVDNVSTMDEAIVSLESLGALQSPEVVSTIINEGVK